MDSTQAARQDADPSAWRWRQLAVVTGVSGLVSIGVLFTAIIAVSSLGEPPLDAPSDEALAFFRAADTTWVQVAEATASLGMLVLLWFVAGLGLLLRRAEGEPPWRSTIALLSGVLVVAYGVLDASWDAATHRGDEIDRALAGYAFDVGNIGFANAWLAMASLAVAAGWVGLTTGFQPRWMAWCAVVSGIGLIVARFLWSIEGLWFLPYGLFWFWVVSTSIQLLRRPASISGRSRT